MDMPVSWKRQAAAITTSASRAFMPWVETMAGSTPARLSSRNRRSAMLATIWMWTQEWSDMSRRSALTCCMYHQACRRRSPFAASSSASSRRLPRVGARISSSGTSTARVAYGDPWVAAGWGAGRANCGKQGGPGRRALGREGWAPIWLPRLTFGARPPAMPGLGGGGPRDAPYARRSGLTPGRHRGPRGVGPPLVASVPGGASTLGVVEPLVDGHGRHISDLRVSVTDRCNFRCQYCMPAEGLPWLERAEVLSFEEIE